MSSISKPSLAEQAELLAASCARLIHLAVVAVVAARGSAPGLPPDRVLEALRRVLSLRQDVWDLDPSLAPSTLDPGLAADLDRLVGLLRSSESESPGVRSAIAAIVLEHAPEDAARRVRKRAGPGSGEAALLSWWESCDETRRLQGAPEYELYSTRRWRRVLAAVDLRRGGGPDLLDAGRTDIDGDARDQWHRENRSRILRPLD